MDREEAWKLIPGTFHLLEVRKVGVTLRKGGNEESVVFCKKMKRFALSNTKVKSGNMPREN